jgi:RecB family exonuclease
MRETILLPAGADLVGRVCDLIEGSGSGPEKNLVLFPSRRPFFFLCKRLAQRRGRALMAPRCYSIDDWVQATAERQGLGRSRIGSEDGAALIYQMHPDCRLPGGGAELSMEEFLAWGFTLFADFEELKIEGVTPKALESVQALAQEPLPGAFGRQLDHLAQWYRDFYRRLEELNLATRASTYDWLAQRAKQIDVSFFAQVIVAGFNALSATEQAIIGALLSRPNAVLIVRDGPGIERTLEQLGAKRTKTEAGLKEPAVSYLRAGDSHGQVMAAAAQISPGPGLSDTVLVLPKEDTVFPVIHHLLPRLGDDWNISMGYPLWRTPLWGLAQAMAKAQEGRDKDSYFLPYYLQLMLHPYIKNLRTDGASYPTRMLLHAMEEELSRRSRRLVSLDLIENDREFRQGVAQRLSGLMEQGFDIDQLFAHLSKIHNLVLKPFEQVASVADLADKMLAVVSAVAEQSPAQRHPYADRFFFEMTGALLNLKSSLLAGQSFKHIRTYFGLMEHFAGQVRVPFPGTSLRGLQVLGFLETRNLKFKRVVMLDVNEGVIPRSSSVDTILPQALRRELNLPTARDRELMDRYHFANLIHGAEEVVLGYSQGGGEQRSRLIEQLVWEEERRQGAPRVGGQRLVHFGARFSQTVPEPLAKTPEMMEAIGGLSYSATMLDCYLECGLRFCHRYLMGIREKEEVLLDIEASELGRLVHQVLKNFFEKRKDSPYVYSGSDLSDLERIIDDVFREQFGPDQDGNVYLIKSQAKARLKKLLWYHRDEMPQLTVLGCEIKRQLSINIPGLGIVPVNGTLDRVDRRGQEIVIVDYKTRSGQAPSYGSFVQAERADWAKHLHSVQLPFYIMLYLEEHGELDPSGINSELLKLGGEKFERKALFSPEDDRRKVYQTYREAMATLIKEIKDPRMPFTGTWNPQQECASCPYKVLCGRQWVGERGW